MEQYSKVRHCIEDLPIDELGYDEIANQFLNKAKQAGFIFRNYPVNIEIEVNNE